MFAEASSQVYLVGFMPKEIASLFKIKQEVVLTAKMFRKNRRRHPDLDESFYRDFLKQLIETPDMVAKNKRDPDILIFYCRIHESKFLRAAILLPKGEKEKDYSPSALSLQFAKPKEFSNDKDRAIYFRVLEVGKSAPYTP